MVLILQTWCQIQLTSSSLRCVNCGLRRDGSQRRAYGGWQNHGPAARGTTGTIVPRVSPYVHRKECRRGVRLSLPQGGEPPRYISSTPVLIAYCPIWVCRRLQTRGGYIHAIVSLSDNDTLWPSVQAVLMQMGAVTVQVIGSRQPAVTELYAGSSASTWPPLETAPCNACIARRRLSELLPECVGSTCSMIRNGEGRVFPSRAPIIYARRSPGSGNRGVGTKNWAEPV
jgi:hypothetical protein